MTETSRIRQSQAGYKREYAFSEDRLTCKLRDTSGEREYSVPYEAIDVTMPSSLALNKTPLAGHLFLAGLLSCLVGWGITSARLPDLVSEACYLFGLILFAVVIANRWTGWCSAKFTVLRIAPPPPGTNGTLMVIRDRHHDEVMTTLTERWKARLKTLHGLANLDADRKQEAARLAWLHDKGVIDDLHYREQIGRLEGVLEILSQRSA